MGRWSAREWMVLLVLLALACTGCDSAEEEDEPMTEITVLFAYAESVADSVDGIDPHLRRALNETNDTYRASNLAMRLVSVGTMPVSYTAADRFDLLRQLLDATDGAMDAVHARRDALEADVVVLVTEQRSETIQAAIMARPETAFVLVWWDGLGAPMYGLAHELAHLHGARHETIRDPVDEPFPYGHGFRNDSLKTIMGGGPLELVPRFSGPDQVHAGVVLGDSTTADVARVLRETATYISNFRGPQAPTEFMPPGTWPTLAP